MGKYGKKMLNGHPNSVGISAHKKDLCANFHNKVIPKIYCMLLHKLCNMPGRYV
jgi:hypothetical protein